ncbi:MAG: plastocyanin/azurin family copper-binding protein [Gemmatimonadota bacterium]
MRARTASFLLLAIAASAACSSSTSPSGGGGGLPVTVGNIFFLSTHNATTNPAVDTIAVGGKVTWTWTNTGVTPHSIESDPTLPGDPTFTSSAQQTGNGKKYTVTFTAAGEYEYDCGVHGSAMSGKIVVQ